MARKRSTLLLLLGIFIILCGSYLGIVKYKENKEAQKSSQEAAEKEANIIRITQMDEVSKISYNNGSEDLSFIRKDDTWYYEPDESCPLNQTLINSLADTVGELVAIRKLEGSDSLDVYGLDSPAYKVTVEDDAGNIITLCMGDETDTNYYLNIEGNDSVYTVGSTLVNSLKKGLYDLIEKESFPVITADTMKKIEVTVDDKKQVFEKELREVEVPETTASETGATTSIETETNSEMESTSDPEMEDVWYITENGGVRTEATNKTSIDNFISGISNLSFQSCDNYNASEEALVSYGLKEPKASVTIHYVEDDEDKTIKLHIGNKDDSGTYYFVRMNDSTAVNTVTQASIDDLITKLLNDFLE